MLLATEAELRRLIEELRYAGVGRSRLICMRSLLTCNRLFIAQVC
jgi:hypothetical protein